MYEFMASNIVRNVYFNLPYYLSLTRNARNLCSNNFFALFNSQLLAELQMLRARGKEQLKNQNNTWQLRKTFEMKSYERHD